MTTIIDSEIDALRARFGKSLADRLEGHIERLSWDAEWLAEHQRARLRALLASAVARSPFHARRLAGIDAEHFELNQLADLPVMSKAQMMASFDELLCDRRLTRARVECQLVASVHEPRLLDDEYICLVSGGSSGLRGIFVQTIDEYIEFASSILRRAMTRVIAAGGPPPDGLPVGIVAAAGPVHSSGFAAAVARGYPVRMIAAPATLPLAELVKRLNNTQPPVLLAHTSALALLAGEQRVGHLQIAPQTITAMSELLSDQARAAIELAFGVPLVNQFVSTEGLVGHSEPGETALSFATDMCIVELVDAENRPTPPGETSGKVLITNLHNHTQPLIRYELTDRFSRHPPAAHDPYLRATVHGRADDVFHYGNIAVDPLVIRTVMVREPAAVEYQVRQTDRGIDIAVVVDGELDWTALASSLQRSLQAAVFPSQACVSARSPTSLATPRRARPDASSPYDGTETQDAKHQGPGTGILGRGLQRSRSDWHRGLHRTRIRQPQRSTWDPRRARRSATSVHRPVGWML
jgi:phenylacetate-coenzyme A ligase PaaK-like adenylate-forming protein